MRGIRWWLAGVAALLIAAPAGAAPKWLRLTTPHFVVVGDAREADLRAVGRRLEQFREVFIRAFPKANAQSPVPSIVVLFQRDAGLAPYTPIYEGKAQEVAGFFQPGPDVNSIAMSLEHADAALPLIFHELAHAILSNTLPWVPTWFGEGFAEFYGTFEIGHDGLTAKLGRASADALALLRGRTFVPLADLLTAEHESALYNEWQRRDVFYAESWALVHYLQVGDPERKGQLAAYLNRVTGGAPSLDAARAAFGDLAALQRELSQYVQRQSFSVLNLRFTTPVAEPVTTTEPLSEAEAAGYLGELLARQGRTKQALAQLSAALERWPGTARIHAAVGLAHLYESHHDDAVKAFRAAVERAPQEPLFHYQLGRALVMGPAQGGDAAALEAARAELERAVSMRPELPDANALLGNVLLAQADPARARPFVVRAAELVPSSESYRLTLARLCLAEGKWAEARATLGPIAAASRDAGTKQSARDLLARAATLERDAAAGASAGTPGHTGEARPESVWVTNVSPPGEGEQQLRGRWESIDCSGSTRLLRVRHGDRTAAYRIGEPQTVAFTWWRPDLPTTVRCGPRGSAEPVVVTWRPLAGPKLDPGIDGDLVRLDVVPDETAPP